MSKKRAKAGATAPLPLAGVRVLELAQFTAGPLCGVVLGDLGADVIKIEPPGGEAARRTMPIVEGVSLYFALYNRNKRAVTLDIRRPEARPLFRRLVRQADVVIESFRPGTLETLGLDYRALRRVNRGIILVSVTGFGQTGPYRDRGSFDMIAQAVGGQMSINGEPDTPPLMMATAPVVYAAGLNGAVATLAALRQRDRTGEGQFIDLALLDSAVSMLESNLSYYALTGEVLPRTGNRRLYTTPTNAFRGKDGYVYIAASTDSLWRRLCETMGRSELAAGPRFRTNPDRRANVDATDAVVAEWTAGLTVAEVVAALESAGVPCGEVNDIPAVVNDPQVRERKLIGTVRHRDRGDIPVPRRPTGLSTLPERPAYLPEAGEHNAEVYGELLGAGARRLANWQRSGLI